MGVSKAFNAPTSLGKVRFCRKPTRTVDEKIQRFQDKLIETVGEPLPMGDNRLFTLHPAEQVNRLRVGLIQLSKQKIAELTTTFGPHPYLADMVGFLDKPFRKIDYLVFLSRIVDYEVATETVRLLARSGRTKLFDVWRHMASLSFDGVQYNQPGIAVNRNKLMQAEKRRSSSR